MGVSTSIFDAARTTLALVKTYLGGDEMENQEPIHDATKDLDADNWNKIAAGLSEVAVRIRKGNLACLRYYIANATAGLTSSQLQVFGPDANRDSVIAPYDGSFIALALHCENARTAGTATAEVSIGGVAGTLSTVIDDDPTQFARSYQLPGIEEFTALDELGVHLTTDGSWAAGSTPSIWADLWISLGEEEEV